MTRALRDFVFPAMRFCLRRPAWLLVPLAAAAAAPAAAQGPCPATGWQQHSSGYVFDYYSGRRADGPGFVHCVRNRGFGLFVDWRGSGLTSPIPPGKLIYTTGPSSRFVPKARPFFYGARRRLMVVPTAVPLASLGPAATPWAWRSGAGPLRRAWKKAAGPVESGDSGALLYVPTDLTLLTDLVRKPLSIRKLIERLEAAPDQLQPFGMTFANRVTAEADGRLAVAWKCRYAMPALTRGSPPFYLRFSDPDLHRRMFGRSEPFAIAVWDAEFEASLPPTAPDQLATRSAKLQILLADRKTVIAAIPISWSGPRG